MAAFAACRYAGEIGKVSGIGTALNNFKAFSVEGKSNTIQFLASLSSFSSPSGYCRRSDYRPFSQFVKSNGGRLFLVDTLALVRKLEAQGIPSKHAEAITSTITEVLNDSLENVAQSLVSKGEIQKVRFIDSGVPVGPWLVMLHIEMTQESNLSKFKSEVESSQGHHFSLLQHETEKLRSDIEKMRSELRRIRDELANQNAETTSLTNKLDREIHALRAQLEAAKYDVIKYCIGTLVSISAVGLAVIRILM
ncbi:hypothetical protein CK203_006103 [Vitis vinifera]|uniref:Protein FMP32, mitochondrial n=1 Tax=Vitis vinifera TaxID=29760 RepID=A0A438K6F9_VITVI|nr:hypothetical protein CK203_006103 [Vitis vinifera]